MKAKAVLKTITGVATCVFGAGVISSVFAQSGSGVVKIGYVLTDEEGSRAVNQKTFDLYEGMGLSVNDFSYYWANGLGLRADITNATLKDRNESVSLFKPGLFTLNLSHDRNRRIYDRFASNVVRRERFASNATLRTSGHTELFGGVAYNDRHGTAVNVFEFRDDTSSVAVDYQNTTFNIGARAFNDKGDIRAEYRHSSFDDNTTAVAGRTGDNFSLRAGVRKIGWDRLSATAGYTYRRDRLDAGVQELVTNLGWATARVTLPHSVRATYRLTFSRTTDRNGQFAETDNATNTITVAKSWRGRYGLRLGYENRISDDLSERTTSNGLIIGGWLRDKKHLNASAEFILRDRNVSNGVTQTGDYTAYRQRVTVRYRDKSWGDVSLHWSGKVTARDPTIAIRDTLTNPNVETRLDYNVVSATANLRDKEYGTLSLTYSYYIGNFNNNSVENTYEFTDHVVRALVKPALGDKLYLSAGGSYHRSRRDQDLERFDLELDAAYQVTREYRAGVTYSAQNFDDFLSADQFYTGNIVELYLKKNIQL